MAAEWFGRLTVVGIEMVVFGLGGVWLDGRLHVEPWFALLGFAVGIALGIYHLLLMTAQERGKGNSSRTSPPAKSTEASRDASEGGDASRRETDK